MGRPNRQIDDAIIARIGDLAGKLCHDATIAGIVEIPLTTLRRRFGKLMTKRRQEGRAELHTAQFDAAIKGDRTMLVWLGKQHLAQADKIEEQVTTTGECAVTYKIQRAIPPTGAAVNPTPTTKEPPHE